MPDPLASLRQALNDRYEIERELGRGGMAAVYLARDLRHDRPVALKVLHQELAATLGAERFLREIRLAARLQHPHILTVLDSGSADRPGGGSEILWFTMPFIRGESLRDRLRRETQLPVEDALRIAREAADALAYAHGEGVIHRDIKPENILLTGTHALVADFGIARALGGGEQLTETGLTVGTPAYMSPEQAAGSRQLDPRTDIYSLAVVLYEMLAGETPFTAPTAQAMVARRFMELAKPVRQLRDAVPEGVEHALQRALARTPADRFADAEQFAAALDVPRTTGASTSTQPAPASPIVPTVPAAVEPTPTSAGRGKRRPIPAAAFTLLLGIIIGLGVLFAWRRTHGDGAPGAERRIAVLPFQNLGDSADAYFADGITDAVRGKLTTIRGMLVTASNSSGEYRGTNKTPQQIGRELGVDYLLVGKVRWQKVANGTSRVQVSPELIEVATAAAKWQQPFDAALTDVFQVQADVAGRVAQALDVAIGSRQQQALADRPTENLAAYDAYLQGKAARAFGSRAATLRQAMGFHEQAVALDSGFVAAWAALSEAASLLYAIAAPSAELAERARSAADRAIALDARHPDGYRALGDYYRRVPNTPARAVEQYAKGLRLAPTDADLLRGLGLAERVLGQWKAAEEHLRRSQSLDPRSAVTAEALGIGLLWTRRYDEAEAAFKLALSLQPSSLQALEDLAMVSLARGDLPRARAILAQPPAGVDLPSFVAYMAYFWDLYWVLDQEQRALVKRLRPSAFDGDAGAWGLTLAGAHEVDGDRGRAAAYGDSARTAFERQLTAGTDDAGRNSYLGTALAYMGRKDEAIRAGQRGVSMQPLSSDAYTGAYWQHQLVRIYILVGEPDKALDRLEPLLKIPYYLSPGWLRIDPTFDPIRNHPRFRRLVDGTS